MYAIFRRGQGEEKVDGTVVADVESDLRLAVDSNSYDVVANLASKPTWIWKREVGYVAKPPERRDAEALARIMFAGTPIDAASAHPRGDKGDPSKEVSNARLQLDPGRDAEGKWRLIRTLPRDPDRGRPNTEFSFDPNPSTTYYIAVPSAEIVRLANVLGDPAHPEDEWQKDFRTGLQVRQVVGLLDWPSGTVTITVAFAAGPRRVGVANAWLVAGGRTFEMVDPGDAEVSQPPIPRDGFTLEREACRAESGLRFETGDALWPDLHKSWTAGRGEAGSTRIGAELHLFLNATVVPSRYRTAIRVVLMVSPLLK